MHRIRVTLADLNDFDSNPHFAKEYRANDPPSKLSGGQQQRVAIARALVGKPVLVLADEPTGNLDTGTSNDVFDLLRRLNRELNTAFIIVTHDLRIAEKSRRIIELIDGRVARDEAVKAP